MIPRSVLSTLSATVSEGGERDTQDDMGARKAPYSQVISSTFLLEVVFWWSVANMEEREVRPVKSADTGRYWGDSGSALYNHICPRI